MSAEFKAFDLFAGAGGLSTGLEMAGFDVLFANEISPAYSETLKANHPKAKVVTEDIRTVDANALRRDVGLKAGELDLLAGGPPCQGFSINAPIRSKDDQRNHLFLEYLRFVREFQPKTIIIENVPGIVSFENGATVRAILDALTQLGYSTALRIVYAAHFGVPQMRWRTIFLGNRLGINPLLFFPEPSHKAFGRANFTTRFEDEDLVSSLEQINASAKRSFTTVGEAILDLPPIPNGGGEELNSYLSDPQNDFQSLLRKGSTGVTNHQCAGLGKANLDRLPHIPQGGSWRDIPHDLLPAGMKRARRSDHTRRYGRLDPRGLGSTILTKCDPHWGTYIHPTQDRVLSVREAARIQSFPDRIRFQGNLIEQYEQVGNAVPPLLSKALGERIALILSSKDRSKFIPSAVAVGDQLRFVLS